MALHIPVDTHVVHAIITLIVLIGAIYSFVREKISPDQTALVAMMILLVTGVLTPLETFSGFSHPATVSVAAVLVLSAGIERTGALKYVARSLIGTSGLTEVRLTALTMVIIGLISAFINNTAAVAIFIPLVLDVCRSTGVSPGRVLMPMAHAATMGGMCTLIGTSTNLVANEFARSQQLPGFSMFEMARVGIPMALIGGGYMLLIGRRRLPSAPMDATQSLALDHRYLAELIVQHHSRQVGRQASRRNYVADYDVDVLSIRRNGREVEVSDDVRIAPGDAVCILGPLDVILRLSGVAGLEFHRPRERTTPPVAVTPNASDADASADGSMSNTERAEDIASIVSNHVLAEVVVLASSGLVGQNLKQARFAERYDLTVLAVRQRGQNGLRPSLVPLRAGDLLVVEGSEAAIKDLADQTGFLIIGVPERPTTRRPNVALAMATLAAVIALASFGVLPIVTAAAAGAIVLMLAGALPPREAYAAIDLRLVFLLAGSLALGAALQKTGMTVLLAKSLVFLTGTSSTLVLLAGFFLVSVVISELMSNSGTVALLGPIAISTAEQLGANPMALLAAVTFGSSAAFAMPIGYQTSLMIYGPGGYTVRDFLRMGIVLDLILAALALLLIPRFWPM